MCHRITRDPLPESSNSPKIRPGFGNDPGRVHLTLPNHRSIPWGVAGMVALVIGIEGFIFRHWSDLTDPVSLSWRFRRRLRSRRLATARSSASATAWSSTDWFRVSSSRTSGMKAANLSAARASTLLTYCLLRRALDSGARPAALIINAKPAVLLGGPEFNARPWQEVLGLRDASELLQITRNAPFVASTLVGRLLPSLRALGWRSSPPSWPRSGARPIAFVRSIPFSGGTGQSTVARTSPRPYRHTTAS